MAGGERAGFVFDGRCFRYFVIESTSIFMIAVLL